MNLTPPPENKAHALQPPRPVKQIKTTSRGRTNQLSHYSIPREKEEETTRVVSQTDDPPAPHQETKKKETNKWSDLTDSPHPTSALLSRRARGRGRRRWYRRQPVWRPQEGVQQARGHEGPASGCDSAAVAHGENEEDGLRQEPVVHEKNACQGGGGGARVESGRRRTPPGTCAARKCAFVFRGGVSESRGQACRREGWRGGETGEAGRKRGIECTYVLPAYNAKKKREKRKKSAQRPPNYHHQNNIAKHRIIYLESATVARRNSGSPALSSSDSTNPSPNSRTPHLPERAQ